MNKKIEEVVEKIDFALLKTQRDDLINVLEHVSGFDDTINGITNFLDDLLDASEEYDEYQILEKILCDGLFYMHSYGFGLKYTTKAYVSAKATWVQNSKIKNAQPSIEEVQVQMIKDGSALMFIDFEGGENDAVLDKQTLTEGLKKAPKDYIDKIVHDEYDADIADTVLQYILWGEVRFA